ncbi:MAG: mechanosensitive ion channel family protein [Candidatus Peregrinibacteria bacterium]|nr:mechanosensitive ion channel family protein [Candidatus Peregrinibacteria bacterium]MCB9808250.1 mechanosensitive ion channel family protein [Candidatus Peribacteria bacterium]
MEQIQTILNLTIGGNTVGEWAVAASVFLGIFIALQMVRKFIISRLHTLAKKSTIKIDDVIAGFFNSMKTPIFFLIALFVAVRGVEVPQSIQLILNIALVVVIVAQAVRLLEEVTVMLVEKQFHKKNSQAPLPGIFRIAIRILLWSVGFLLILSNIGVDITSLVAGLGIGGLAVSLALQSILTDMFSSFSIAVDRPFEVGDFIIVGEHKGTVKHIGLKTTRIEALEGEEIVISNTELTTARVRNYKKMHKRRIQFSIGVTYDTTPEKLRLVNDIVKQSIEGMEHVEFDRSHFKTFGDSALLFEVVYFMLISDYAVYMNAQQEMNLKIHEAFTKEGIEMAFPTQTIVVKKQ